MNQPSRLSLVESIAPAPGPGVPGGQAGWDGLVASAVSEVLIMSADANSGPIGEFRRIAHANLRAGVRCRALFPDSARLSSTLSGLSLAGAQVRTDAEVPMEALVIDRRSVVLPVDRTGSGNQTGVAVFRLPGVVTATAGLFERIWQAAVPLAPTELPDPDEQMLTDRERDLLALLCSGSTDESAAAQLGISVRTVGRMVADIMNRLGARSRFQAGAKAVDRGWLMAKAG
ncbi:LuxR C-terminal-related transcriptional regulator [Amycolatopsis sp. NPDC059027]|uniref:helix-turn-helix transcriptional regulator n=1 Tax=unclassified Amycolatopsis TaxID=2618356 RepID=UPI00366B94BE